MVDVMSLIGRDCEVIFSAAGVSDGYTGVVSLIDDDTISVTPASALEGDIVFENGQPANVPKSYPHDGRIRIADIQQIIVRS
jgi:hypothetical protein